MLPCTNTFLLRLVVASALALLSFLFFFFFLVNGPILALTLGHEYYMLQNSRL